MVLKIKRGKMDFENGFEVCDKKENNVLTVDCRNFGSAEKMSIKDCNEQELFFINESPNSGCVEYTIYTGAKEVAKVKNESFKVIPIFNIVSPLGNYKLKRTIHNGLELYDDNELMVRAFIKIVGFGENHVIDIKSETHIAFFATLMILIFRMGKRHFVK